MKNDLPMAQVCIDIIHSSTFLGFTGEFLGKLLQVSNSMSGGDFLVDDISLIFYREDPRDLSDHIFLSFPKFIVPLLVIVLAKSRH